jgi:hypothetical protein
MLCCALSSTMSWRGVRQGPHTPQYATLYCCTCASLSLCLGQLGRWLRLEIVLVAFLRRDGCREDASQRLQHRARSRVKLQSPQQGRVQLHTCSSVQLKLKAATAMSTSCIRMWFGMGTIPNHELSPAAGAEHLAACKARCRQAAGAGTWHQVKEHHQQVHCHVLEHP